MKLYTEEQVREAYNRGRTDWINEIESYNILSTLTPIELPSDEEIDELLERKSSVNLLGFITGVKWMKEQILGKEDKTFKQKSKWTEVDNMTRRLK